MSKQYDVVVIGAGSAGLTAAVGFSKVGKRVLLVEKEHMGGECTNSGCIPSKALLHAAKSGMTGKQALAYTRETIAEILAEETPETFEKIGIDVVMGEATFVSQCAVEVAGTRYTYKQAIIATGSSPRVVEIPGLSETRVLTNQNLFTLEDIPERLLIVGGGPIGLEMAQAFALLGSQVTIAERGDELARLEDPMIRQIIHDQFAKLGITVQTNTTLTSVIHDTTAVLTDDQGETHETTFDQVLIAIGRVPNLPGGLSAAGIATDNTGIQVDSQYRTSNKYVYAIGDVTNRLKFTHTADDIARQVVTRVTTKGLLRVNTRKSVPKVTYTAPEIAQVGMLEEEALAKYGAERIMRIDVPYTLSDRAKTDQETTGHLVVTVRRINGAILGANLIGPSAGELIAVFTLAIDHKISLWQLRRLIFAYPTYGLVIKKAGDLFFATQLGSLKADIRNLLRRHAPKALTAAVWVAGLSLLYSYQTNSGMSVRETSIAIFDFITMTFWGPLLYILVYTIRPVTFFPAVALTILAGIFFGLLWGTVFTIIGALGSAAVTYLVGRFFGQNLHLEDSVVGNWVTALRKNTFAATLTTRLIFLPYDLIGYLAGILGVRFVPFITATFLGIILGTTTFVSIGAALDVEEFAQNGFSTEVIDPSFWVLSGLIFVASLGLSKVLKRWKAEA